MVALGTYNIVPRPPTIIYHPNTRAFFKTTKNGVTSNILAGHKSGPLSSVQANLVSANKKDRKKKTLVLLFLKISTYTCMYMTRTYDKDAKS